MNSWNKIAEFILKQRLLLLILLGASTIVMGFFASKVKISNEFNRSIPTDNPKYIEYLNFKNKFGEDGNVMVVGFKTDKIFEKDFFNAFQLLSDSIKKIDNVKNVLVFSKAINVIKDTATNKFFTQNVFPNQVSSQHELDSCFTVFKSLPFYKGLLYNDTNNAVLMAITIDKNVMNTPKREALVNQIQTKINAFASAKNIEPHLSGLPLLRTLIAKKISKESTLFTIVSLALTALILLVFFRSFAAMFYSLITVFIGVIFSLGTVVLLGYKISLLTALAPTLIVVIGIPNCVYLINKYHTELNKGLDKMKALHNVIEKMGVVTLFTNLTAAIGFGVFVFTKSAILFEFGMVAGINIILIFIISLIFIPCVFSYLPTPSAKHTDYMDNKWLTAVLDKIENWVFNHRIKVYLISLSFAIVGIVGILRLQALSFIIDDLPKKDVLYTDLKFFETNFKGIMPFEIVIDCKKKKQATSPKTFIKIAQLEKVLAKYSAFSKPLSLAQGVKFATQAYYNGDASQFRIPTDEFEQAFVYGALLKNKGSGNKLNTMLASFIDSTKQTTRVSISMMDVGSKRLPAIIDSLRPQIDKIFDTAKYKVTFTGTSVTFLEGTKFIVNGLRDSLILAFLSIIFCMIWLFRSWRILLISLVPNILPIIITAGVMGWMGIALKPSTVLIFSISLGIAIDVTIRFLVNYKQELATHNFDIPTTVKHTVHETGVSIIYTSLILFAGFFIFCISGFGGIIALGLLTSLTLILSMITNLTLLPCLLLWLDRQEKK
jgi:predicted RND superfamily exporter protein